MFVVVAYDISDDPRRLRVMKALKGYGEHVQDNVRLYHLCNADVNRIQELGVGREVQLLREFAIV
jgi:CRISPR/Cas system-associated endoribonuclease Cas2